MTKSACDKCGSSDGVETYDDGTHCFVCKANGRADGSSPSNTSEPDEFGVEEWTKLKGDYMGIKPRGITEETCKKIGYQVTLKADGERKHLMNIKGDRGELIGQKTRDKDKNFAWRGPAAKNPPIYMSWLWPDKGKSVTLTEGELDAASYYQAFDHKWPVGSLPNGTGSVKKAIQRDYEKLLRFDTINLCFDQDEPGRKALEEACELLPAGRVKIITLPEGCKDANETLLKHGPAALIRAFWDAKAYRPDGIVLGEEFDMDRITKATATGYALELPELQKMTLGLRKGEITMLSAGSGIGKSTWARELAYELHQKHGVTIGNVYLEENNTKTAQGYVALHCGVPLGRLRFDPTILSDGQWADALENVIRKRMVFYDHFGSLDNKRLLSKLRYMAQVLKVDFIVLDHISIVTSGIQSSSEGERKDIDIFMTNLRSLVEETGVGVIAIVHLKRAQGKNFNEGSQVSLSDFRGSASLEQLSDNCYALERNQQAKDKSKQTQTHIRVLKCRETGETGQADVMNYDRNIGRNVLVSDFDAAQEFDPHDETEEDKVF